MRLADPAACALRAMPAPALQRRRDARACVAAVRHGNDASDFQRSTKRPVDVRHDHAHKGLSIAGRSAITQRETGSESFPRVGVF